MKNRVKKSQVTMQTALKKYCQKITKKTKAISKAKKRKIKHGLPKKRRAVSIGFSIPLFVAASLLVLPISALAS